MTLKDNYYTLKSLAVSEGMALFGVADITAISSAILLPDDIKLKLKYAVSIGYRLSKAVLQTIVDSPNQSYYFHYQRANILLDATSLKLTALIQSRGYDAFPVPASQVLDWEKQLGALSHREIARLAGLGWYGRNNLLVNKTYGSQLRYATILTDMPLQCDTPVEDNCGECRLCIQSCPAGAIAEDSFNLDLCSKQLKQFIKDRKVGQMICGVCVKACAGKSK